MLWPCLICRIFSQRETSCLLSFLGLLLIPPQGSYPKSKQKPRRAHPSVISVFVFLEETHIRPLLLPTLGLYPGQSFTWICKAILYRLPQLLWGSPSPMLGFYVGPTYSSYSVSPVLCVWCCVYTWCCSKVAVLNLGVLTSSTNLYLQKDLHCDLQ